MVGWSEDWRVMLNSTQDQSELKLKLELSLAISCTYRLSLVSEVILTRAFHRACREAGWGRGRLQEKIFEKF